MVLFSEQSGNSVRQMGNVSARSSMTLLRLLDFFLSNHISPYKGNQVYKWLWEKGVNNFDAMTNLSISHRSLLRKNFKIRHVTIKNKQSSNDKTIKYSIKL